MLKDELAVKIASNFNNTQFTLKDLTEDSYYVKSGYGPQTQTQINVECKKKFPNKTFSDLKYNLNATDIISYAYFVKEVQYLTPFETKPSFHFMGKPVRGFKASSNDHRKNVELLEYSSDDDFMVRLKLKQPNE